MMRLAHMRPSFSKKRLVIIAVLLTVLVAAGGYALWSRHEWARYTPTYTQRHQSLAAELKTVTALPTANDKERAELMARLQVASERISFEQKQLCDISPMVAWQGRFISAYDTLLRACQEKAVALTVFQKHLDNSMAYIKDDQAVANIFAKALPSGELDDSKWKSQVDVWDKAVISVAGLAASDAFKPVQQQAVAKMSAVKDAWVGLVAAHELKDKAKYLAAQGTLGTSYDGLNAITTDSKARFDELSAKLRTAYAASFKM